MLEMSVFYLDQPFSKASSEQTCYRRFAMLLDILFSGTDIVIKDGETVCEAIKDAMELSMYGQDDPTFGRKIDMLLTLEGSCEELSSNEWKSLKTDNQRFIQQSKNIRTNCAILNKLQIDMDDAEQVLAMDMTGDVGYIYRLQRTGDVDPATVKSVFILSRPTFIKRPKTSRVEWKKDSTFVHPSFACGLAKRHQLKLCSNGTDF
ncbi:uncharacterized protein BYT42DRAFT_41056 [Radiomyces spectabilis]|uniref:uncharacterized protein n=1 Tax=Radiomyces spectabilis TaxID=64574 RepID=UPI002220E0BC|nr:uncharacterized protein BYT42DRAFT_41056 [Radiomyces spectabilis]KAI8394333.1 hypothetical protein BYT42DRAFT_41056 [Radiomyces spectabilis]